MKRTTMLFRFIMICFLTLPLATLAQGEATIKAKEALRQLAAKYLQSPHLGFEVLYRYADENNPGQYKDTLRGQFRIHGLKYWSMLDKQETVCDARLLLTVFNEDSILFLSKAASMGGTSSPLAMMDSLILRDTANKYSYSETSQEVVVSVSLAGNNPCRKMTWHIDRNSGWLTVMESQLQANQLYDPSIRSQVEGGTSHYVTVEMVYSNYQTGGFTDSVFDLSRFIRKEGNSYITIAPYHRFKVFKGAPDL